MSGANRNRKRGLKICACSKCGLNGSGMPFTEHQRETSALQLLMVRSPPSGMGRGAVTLMGSSVMIIQSILGIHVSEVTVNGAGHRARLSENADAKCQMMCLEVTTRSPLMD